MIEEPQIGLGERLQTTELLDLAFDRAQRTATLQEIPGGYRLLDENNNALGTITRTNPFQRAWNTFFGATLEKNLTIAGVMAGIFFTVAVIFLFRRIRRVEQVNEVHAQSQGINVQPIKTELDAEALKAALIKRRPHLGQ